MRPVVVCYIAAVFGIVLSRRLWVIVTFLAYRASFDLRRDWRDS